VLTTETTNERATDRRRTARPMTLVWLLMGLAVVLLVVGVVVGAMRQPAKITDSRAEGVVQAYIEAVLDRDHAAAVGYLSEDTAARCTAAAFRQAWVPEGVTADLEGVQVSGQRAEVRVRLRTTAEPFPLEGGGYSSTEAFTLVEEDGAWQITGEPWPLVSCTGPW
jgi:hypothetical protein